ncbi:cadherin-like beta sandwich domain-containing protein [Niastella yeongjuensis]|nr:cadherin-like beta sandwich domain-containing protein [Niastella yeongjuensis]
MRKLYLLLMGMLLIACPELFAQVSITTMNTAYTQDFNTLVNSGTGTLAANMPPGWLFSETTGNTDYTASTGSSTAGDTYSFGATGSSDRAFGTIASNTSQPAIGAGFTNNTGSTINALTISFTGEQWRLGATGGRLDRLDFQYSLNATGLTTGTWTDVDNLDLNTPNPGGTTTGMYDGNASTNQTAISYTISGLSIAPGATFYIRWNDVNISGNDDGLGIDDFSLTAASTDASLTGLVISSGTLSPAFSAATTSYTASVGNAVNSLTVTPTTNAIATITVNGISVTSGNSSSAIPLNEGVNTITTIVTAQDGVTTKTYTITVTRATSGTPTIIQGAALSGFGNVCVNTTTGPNSFTMDGADLDGSNISLAALPGFLYSESAGGPYTSTLGFSYAGTSFTGKTIYVTFNPIVEQAYDGNIVVSGGGITPVNIAVAGTGINTTATVNTGASSGVTTTMAIAGSIASTGCSPITGYGLEYSLVSPWLAGTGTQVPASNLSGGNFSVTLSGLNPNQKMYYKAYVTTSGGTAYGTELSFINTTLPVSMASQPGMTYTQDFTDIASWTSFFINGNGANHFNGLVVSGAGAIPNANVITTQTGTFASGSSGGVQKGTDQSPATQSIVLLSTGPNDNTSSAAFDFYMDFSGVNAGTLSFDWASINNATGDRNGSLRVYASIDGTNWTELTFADVLNFTNNSPTSGTQSNIALPAIFNNSATARLRFYYHNAAAGTTPTGSRPKISIDNLKVTAVATTPCVNPAAAPTALTFGTITDVSIQGSFTAASPAVDNYLVIASTSSSLTSNPVDGQIYNIGDNVGDGTVIANGNSTSFTATGLNASTQYYFFIYSLNSICTGGPLYYPTPLIDQATTNAGLPPCAAPASQPTALTFGTTTPGTIQGSFTATTADEYLVLVSTSASLSSNPVNAQAYATGDVIGNATVVSRSSATTFTASNLVPNTPYYFYVFSLQLQNCLNGPAYNITAPLTASQNTQPLPPCATPTVQPANITFNASNTSISGAFTAGTGADDYLVISSTSPTLSATPVDNTDYNVGDNIGGGVVVANTTTTSFLVTNLTPNTTNYFFVFAANKNCTGGTKYLTTAPLSGTQATNNLPVNNYYFGTLHSHSDYSDGNQDQPGKTPADDYAYAKNAQCMDFLGISEHNHYSNFDNPGNQIDNYHKGSVQANAFTAANSNFLALYGMEWGVINNGGHVVVYGDGMDDLFGWESGSGGWGSSNNYDVYVAKNDYTGPNGLFKTINDNVAKNTFATLAHPNSSDYNNLSNTTYNTVADNAITGSAVESGPATSTNTTYTNPGSSMFYLGYFQKLLALGYHLGPVIDHDNHNTTFGHTTYSRTAVLAPSLTKTDIIKGYRDMHFYATQDCDTKVDFTINTRMMGSVFTDRNAPIINVSLSDNTTSVSNAVINVMTGVPGSGVAAQKITSVTGSSMTFQDNNLADLATGYYYLDITNGSARIITAPIWYTRNDINTSLPVTFLSFTGKLVNEKVKLDWTTAQETNSKEFIVERSTDGRTFNAIGKVAAAGNSNHATSYSYTDAQPVNGMNYYRLQQVDLDGKSILSAVVKVRTDRTGGFYVGPNPAHSSVTIYRQGSNEAVRVELMDVNGKTLQQLNMAAATYTATFNVSSLPRGIYLMKFTSSTGIQTEKIMVE